MGKEYDTFILQELSGIVEDEEGENLAVRHAEERADHLGVAGEG